jgi:hypothetical protein
MVRRLVVIALMLGACLAAGAAEKRAKTTPDFSGMWVLDPINSQGDSLPRNTTVVIIRQVGDQLTFSYYRTRETDTDPSAVEEFTLDGRSRKRYSSRTQIAYARAKFKKDALVIDTTTTMDVNGTQSFSDSERWTISTDGKTLTQKVSDGTVVVYHKGPQASVPQ